MVIATRHDCHAELVCRALAAGKHVFVEKPLALTVEDIKRIEEAHDETRVLMVGYNRRFSPLAVEMKRLLVAVPGPKAMVYTVNAGAIPREHWTQGEEGGGRIRGEVCHFLDFLRFAAGAAAVSVQRTGVGSDGATVTVRYADGSVGTVHYVTGGHAAFPKERVEVFADGKVLRIDNWRRLEWWGFRGFSSKRLWRQDKGADGMAAAFLRSVSQGGAAPIPFEELVEVVKTTLAAAGDGGTCDPGLKAGELGER